MITLSRDRSQNCVSLVASDHDNAALVRFFFHLAAGARAPVSEEGKAHRFTDTDGTVYLLSNDGAETTLKVQRALRGTRRPEGVTHYMREFTLAGDGEFTGDGAGKRVVERAPFTAPQARSVGAVFFEGEPLPYAAAYRLVNRWNEEASRIKSGHRYWLEE